jgi:uroporphyrinogen decarboxylase
VSRLAETIAQVVPQPAALHAYLEDHYGRPATSAPSPWERVATTLAHRQPDRVPFDFWAVPEVGARLRAALDADDAEVLRLLGSDCRMLAADYAGCRARELPDGTYICPWGTHRRRITHDFGAYAEYASHPLAGAESVAEVQDWDWPHTDEWDVSGIPAQIEAWNDTTRYHLRFEVGGIFEWSWALRGLERFLLDLVDQPEIACAIMDRFTDVYIANTLRVIEAAGGQLDMVYTYDDVGIQHGLLLSPQMWRRYILPRHQRLNAAIRAAAHPVKIMYHSCGAIYPLIASLVDEMGIDVLNPLQPRAQGMNLRRIKAEFGDRVSFHGAIDIQRTLPRGTPDEIQAEVRERCAVLGRGGGYICTSAHYIQADTPLENVVALYTAPREIDSL